MPACLAHRIQLMGFINDTLTSRALTNLDSIAFDIRQASVNLLSDKSRRRDVYVVYAESVLSC